jgi:hypothetical protein
MAGLKLSQLSGVWSNNPAFIRYLNHLLNLEGDSDKQYGRTSQDLDPADYIREVCGVESRRELDVNAEAARVFHSKIREPFMKWAKRVHLEAV